MIVRLMGEGQFRVSQEVVGRLNELDDRAQASADANDEAALDGFLDEMWQIVRQEGEELPTEELTPSDFVIPPSDLTLEETRQLFSHEGLIPDPPSA